MIQSLRQCTLNEYTVANTNPVKERIEVKDVIAIVIYEVSYTDTLVCGDTRRFTLLAGLAVKKVYLPLLASLTTVF